MKKLKSIVSSLLVAFLMIFSSAAPVLAANDKETGNPNGNNGTLKVHELGTPSGTEPVPGTENNDPKVCAFNFEGFDFDEDQGGYVMIDVQGGSSPVGVSTGPYAFGPTDETGYAETEYFNNGGATVVDGTYKATLYGKDTGNPSQPDLTDEKAKSKVFKVECEEEDDEIEIPATPAVTDECGVENAAWVVPTDTAELDWELEGNGDLNVTILTPDTTFTNGETSHNYGVAVETNTEECPRELDEIEIRAIPSVNDLCGEGNAEWVVPADTAELDWELGQDGHLTVEIKTDNTVFTDQTTSHDYGIAVETNTEACPEECPDEEEVILFNLLDVRQDQTEDECEEPEDVCINLGDVQETVPAGMTVDADGNCSTPGGQVLADTDTTPAVLVETGSDAALTTFVALFLLGTTAAIKFATRKSKVTV